MSKETRSYQDALGFTARGEMNGRPILEGPLQVTLRAVMVIPASWSKKKQQAALVGEIRPTSKPDMDNIVKMLDALNGIVWKDDAQVVKIDAEKRYGVSPCLVVTIQPA